MMGYVQGIMLTVLEMLCCKLFFEAFGKRRVENSWRNYGIMISLVIFVYYSAVLFYEQFLLKQLLIILLIVLHMILKMKISIRKSFFLALLFQALLLSIDYFTLWLNVSLFYSIAEINESHYIGGCLVAILSKIFLFLVVLAVRRSMEGRSSEVLMDAEWLRFLFFPVFTIFTITAMLLTTGNLRNQKQGSVFLIIALCLAVMNIIVFYLIEDILKRETKLRESKILKLKAQNQTDMYRSISENFDNQQKRIHEYKNQIMCIESLCREKSYAELEKYISKISGQLNTQMHYIKTNHVIIDAILNSKYQEIIDKKIVFVFKINDLSKLEISDEDIVVILLNLLNNAIEACDKCAGIKIIKMKFIKEDEKVIISVKNTYDGRIVVRDGEILTSKKNETGEHGIGIKNIIATIAKYEGSHVIQNNGNEFYFSAIIPQK